jgi:hypothetical protein
VNEVSRQIAERFGAEFAEVSYLLIGKRLEGLAWDISKILDDIDPDMDVKAFMDLAAPL